MKDICFHRTLSLIIMNAIMGFAEEFWCVFVGSSLTKPSQNLQEKLTERKQEHQLKMKIAAFHLATCFI